MNFQRVRLARHACWYLFIASILWLSQPLTAAAQSSANNVKTDSRQNAAPRDGQHDFGFERGKWKAHVKKLLHPLTGSKEWEEFDGTVVTTPFMEGKGNLSEMNVDGATSHTRIQIIAVRLQPRFEAMEHLWRERQDGCV